jgi:hypothetical protein
MIQYKQPYFINGPREPELLCYPLFPHLACETGPITAVEPVPISEDGQDDELTERMMKQ